MTRRSRAALLIIATIAVAVVVLVPIAYRSWYRSVEWYLWSGPRPLAGSESRWMVEIHANRFTDERIAFLSDPEGKVVLSRVFHVSAKDSSRVQVRSEGGGEVWIDDPVVHQAVVRNGGDFTFGYPIPRGPYRHLPKLETDYSRLPAPVD